MSGLEIVGAVASVAQLLHYSAVLAQTLCNFYRHARTSSERLQGQLSQVDQLIKIAQLVQRTKTLDTPLVNSHLRSILDTIFQLENTLQRMLSEVTGRSLRQYWRLISLLVQEKDILDAFTVIEAKKSSLSLCIFTTYSIAIEHRLGMDKTKDPDHTKDLGSLTAETVAVAKGHTRALTIVLTAFYFTRRHVRATADLCKQFSALDTTPKPVPASCTASEREIQASVPSSRTGTVQCSCDRLEELHSDTPDTTAATPSHTSCLPSLNDRAPPVFDSGVSQPMQGHVVSNVKSKGLSRVLFANFGKDSFRSGRKHRVKDIETEDEARLLVGDVSDKKAYKAVMKGW